jgi:agmatinase
MSLFDYLDVVDFGDAICSPGMVEASHCAIRERVSEVVRRGIVPIVLGGDHSVTWPAATAVADHHGFARVGMIHFDAHADADDVIAGNRASHGTPMRRLIESKAIAGSDFVQIGLRGYWPCDDTLDWMHSQGMRAHTMTEIWERGCRKVVQDVVDWARGGPNAFYLSVDVDVLDPGFAPGTGTPEPGGMTSIDLLQAVRRVAREVNIVGMDVVELSPPYDQSDVTTHIALRVIFEALVAMAQRRRDSEPAQESRPTASLNGVQDRHWHSV